MLIYTHANQEYALKYAELGLEVFPCHYVNESGMCSCGKSCSIKAGKHPMTLRGFHDATTDETQIQKWWQENPYANIGIVTGEKNHLLVLDIDPRNGGLESLNNLIQQYGSPPPTAVVQTGGQGYHYYFFYSGDKRIPCITGLRPGIDIKASGGYVIAPMSNHTSLQKYTWGTQLPSDNDPEPPSWLMDLINEHLDKTKKALIPYIPSTKGRDDLSLEEITNMLSYIPDDLDYLDRCRVVWGVTNYLGGEGVDLILEWMPPYLDRNQVQKLFSNNNGSVTIGTVIYLAKQNGYKTPAVNDLVDLCSDHFQVAHAKDPGPATYVNLYSQGDGYISILGQIYRYQDEYYTPLEEDAEQSRIMKCLSNYPTSFSKDGQPSYAWSAPKHAKQAYTYVTMVTNSPLEDVNPPGINLNNGYLQITYDRDGKPVPTLIEHSPKHVFTYKAPFEYNPHANFDMLNEALTMVEPEQLEILLRVLSLAFDLPTVRKKGSRINRQLFLYGDGENGKDTLRVWIEMMYGGNGVTSVSLQDFMDADNGKRFGLHSLAHSCINWSSENKNVGIDTCQSLKQFATGDSLTIEKKHKDSVVIKPKAIGLYNVNTLPKIRGNQNAIRSRFGIIHFPYIFKSNPVLPNEKKADPRFKEDPEFISKHILPALLNLLLEKFALVLQEGIDYSASDVLMAEVCESNSHMYEFIEEYEVKHCELEKGILVAQIFSLYERWCLQKSYLTLSDGHKRYNDPSPSDRIVKSDKQMRAKLREFFPNLKDRKTTQGRQINLQVRQ